MKILYVGGEALPFASTGGLGEVMSALPAAVAKSDPSMDVRAVMPLYSGIPKQYRDKMVKVDEFSVYLSWRCQYCGVWKLVQDGVIWYFIDNEYYFKRDKIYGYFDDGERFAYFSMAVIEMMSHIGFYPDILHANDWQSALSIVYLKLKYRYDAIKTVYTIHNIEYQGIYGREVLGDLFGIDDEHFGIVEFNGCIDLTKAAIVCCDRLTTVSERYSEEIKTPEYAHGLHRIISDYGYKTTGIVNGIDYTYYDPRNKKDLLGDSYSAVYKTFTGKESNKEALQQYLGLPVRKDAPLVSMITRLASHKGLDIVNGALEEFLQRNVQFVVLGTGEKEYESYFTYLQEKYPEKVAACIKFDKQLSKWIYAGSDIFLMPSKSEPCGLSQMIASRYGAIPLVRETGGLADTIKAFDPTTGEGNGVTFVDYNSHELLRALTRACDIWYDNGDRKKLVKNAMKMDFTWNASAGKYIELYKEL